MFILVPETGRSCPPCPSSWTPRTGPPKCGRFVPVYKEKRYSISNYDLKSICYFFTSAPVSRSFVKPKSNTGFRGEFFVKARDCQNKCCKLHNIGLISFYYYYFIYLQYESPLPKHLQRLVEKWVLMKMPSQHPVVHMHHDAVVLYSCQSCVL